MKSSTSSNLQSGGKTPRPARWNIWLKSNSDTYHIRPKQTIRERYTQSLGWNTIYSQIGIPIRPRLRGPSGRLNPTVTPQTFTTRPSNPLPYATI